MAIRPKRKTKARIELPGGYTALIKDTGFDRGKLYSQIGNAAFPQWLLPSTRKSRKPRGYNG